MATKRKAVRFKGAPEDKEQQVLARWLDVRGVLWCHVPNGGHRDIRVGRRLKSHGTKAGVPDVLIFERPMMPSDCIGVAIELKRNDYSCKPTPEQVAWLDALRERGWYADVCHGAVEAIALLMRLGI